MKTSCFKGFLLCSFLLLTVYPAYKIKSALGIDIVPNIHTPDLIKGTVKAIAHRVN